MALILFYALLCRGMWASKETIRKDRLARLPDTEFRMEAPRNPFNCYPFRFDGPPW